MVSRNLEATTLIRAGRGWGAVLGTALIMAGGLVPSVPVAGAAEITVLDEDFDDVTWGPGVEGRRGRTKPPKPNRSVDSILSTSPWELPGGTSASSSKDVGVRASTDKINTARGKAGFDRFFDTGAFAVLGDQKNKIGGAGNLGVFRLDVPFTLAGDVDGIDLSYDWAFDGKAPKPPRHPSGSTAPYDLFTVSILDEEGETLLVQQLTSTAFGSGHFQLDGLPMLGGQYALRFELGEHASRKTNSAIGIDNIVLTAYSGDPSPSSGDPSQEPLGLIDSPLAVPLDAVVQVPAPAGLILLTAGLAVLAARRARAR